MCIGLFLDPNPDILVHKDYSLALNIKAKSFAYQLRIYLYRSIREYVCCVRGMSVAFKVYARFGTEI